MIVCYVNPAYHKLKTFPLLRALNQSEAFIIFIIALLNLHSAPYYKMITIIFSLPL